jgi:hypothetical protein
MQTGMINIDNSAQILRSIAQKRQNGSLEIIQGTEKINIIFSNGKIIDAFLESENTVARAARRIEMVGETGSEEILRTVVKHDVLNFLFDINLNINSTFTFNNYMPQFEEEYSANISVGQYLLDKAAFEPEFKRFKERFPDDCVILKLEPEEVELSEEEQIMYESMPERSKLEDLMQESILSRYHTILTLLLFREKGVIEIEGTPRLLNEEEDSIPVLETPEAAATIRKNSEDLKKPEKQKRPFKWNSEKYVPQILSALYIISLFSIIYLAWGSFLSCFQ